MFKILCGVTEGNPVVDIPAGGAYEFDCVLPLYGGEFRVVVEGMLPCAQEVYAVRLFGGK